MKRALAALLLLTTSGLHAGQSSVLDSSPDPPSIDGASLPKADRRLVRSEAMNDWVLAAARTRSPRANSQQAQC